MASGDRRPQTLNPKPYRAAVLLVKPGAFRNRACSGADPGPAMSLQGWKIPPHLPYAGRGPSASPAAGFASVHAEEQKQLCDDALNLVRFKVPSP